MSVESEVHLRLSCARSMIVTSDSLVLAAGWLRYYSQLNAMSQEDRSGSFDDRVVLLICTYLIIRGSLF